MLEMIPVWPSFFTTTAKKKTFDEYVFSKFWRLRKKIYGSSPLKMCGAREIP